MKKIVLSTLVVLGLTGAAFAQEATDFVAVDTDASNAVSFEEAQVAWPDLTVEAFAGKKETVHIVHVAVDHVAGAMSLWEAVGDGIEIGVYTELENSV